MKRKLIIATSCFLLPTPFFSHHVNGQEWEDRSSEYTQYRFGGYGEILYQQMDYGESRLVSPSGAASDSRSTLAVPRAVFTFDYKFTPSLSIHTEIEFEYLGTGSGMEFDANSEGGEYEYEIEKGGEVAVEQLYIHKRFAPWLNLSAGHMVLPVGLTNAHHEPTLFFGTSRPESETMILPSTWHETGIAVSGIVNDFRYQLMYMSGLDPNYFNDEKWVAGGSQGRYEVTKFTNPALVWRLDYHGLRYTRFGFSGYYGKTEKNSSRTAKMTGVDGYVTILSGDAQYKSPYIQARANVIWGNLGNSDLISQRNTQFPKDMGFPRTVVAKNALSYGGEVGYDIGHFIQDDLRIFPFVRYDSYNSMHKTVGTIVADPRYKCEAWTFGVNYYPLPCLAIKADYKHRRIDRGNYNDENTFAISIGYAGWFFQK